MRFTKSPETITQRDMLMSWAIAEIDSKLPSSLGTMFAANPRAVAKTIAGALSDEQEAAVLGALLSARSGVLGYIIKRPLTWYRGTVRLADLARGAGVSITGALRHRFPAWWLERRAPQSDQGCGPVQRERPAGH